MFSNIRQTGTAPNLSDIAWHPGGSVNHCTGMDTITTEEDYDRLNDRRNLN